MTGGKSACGLAAALAVIAMLGLVVAACGGSSHRTPTTRSTATKPGTTTAGSTPTKTVAERTADFYAGFNIDSLPHYRITVLDLRRMGSFVVLDLAIRCADTNPCGLHGTFNSPACRGGAPCLYHIDNMVLVDPTGRKVYYAVNNGKSSATSEGEPWTSLLDGDLNPGAPPVLAWAVYPAPPAGTKTMDVDFRYGGATIPAVPITTGPAPKPASVAAGAQPAQPPQGFPPLNASASAQGLQEYEHPLVLNVGSPTGSTAETPHRTTITLRSDVLFAFAKSKLTAKARGTLARLAPQIKARANGPVRVTGYTDSIGTDAVNIPLSKARAAAVVGDLKPLTAGVRYVSAGRGSADPIAPNTTPTGADNPAGRALNRRVTIVIPVKAPAPPTPPPAAKQTGPAPSSGTSVTFHPLGNNPTDTYVVSPVSLSRDGSLALLRFRITCHAHQAGAGCYTEVDFTGTHTVPPLPYDRGGGNPNKVAGLYLTDPSTGLIYPPVYDSTGYDVMSDITSGIPDGATLPAWVYFPVPPAARSKMVLHMPGGSPALTVSLSPLPHTGGG